MIEFTLDDYKETNMSEVGSRDWSPITVRGGGGYKMGEGGQVKFYPYTNRG